jgi:hypothetical protein
VIRTDAGPAKLTDGSRRQSFVDAPMVGPGDPPGDSKWAPGSPPSDPKSSRSWSPGENPGAVAIFCRHPVATANRIWAISAHLKRPQPTHPKNTEARVRFVQTGEPPSVLVLLPDGFDSRLRAAPPRATFRWAAWVSSLIWFIVKTSPSRDAAFSSQEQRCSEEVGGDEVEAATSTRPSTPSKWCPPTGAGSVPCGVLTVPSPVQLTHQLLEASIAAC